MKNLRNPRVTAAEFIKFKVTDRQAVCSGCGPNTGGNTPVVIKGEQYCVWCALEIAERLLSPGGKSRFDRRVEKILKARAQ